MRAHPEFGRLTMARWWLVWSLSSLAAYFAFIHHVGVIGPLYAESYVLEDQEDIRQPEVEPKNDPLDQKESTWRGLELLRSSASIQALTSAMSSWKWPTIGFSDIQARFSALLLELSLGPGSLYSEIVDEPPDVKIYPEMEWDAAVRFGEELCFAERAFLSERKRTMKSSFARLLGVPENAIDERDLPIVAIAGSGGGFRAMLNTSGSLIAAERSGILSCTAYTAGVSGSCWALGVLHSGVAGSLDPYLVSRHIQDRIRVSYLDRSTLDALITPPTNKYLLSSFLRKAAGPTGVVSLVDIYGTLLGSRLFVPADLSRLDPQHLSLHLMRRTIDKGQLPLPIFTAVQHVVESDNIAIEVQTKKTVTTDGRSATISEEAQEQLVEVVRCLWYEFTPYEIGCDELGAWIPSWSLGRRFRQGKNIEKRPELGFTILTGIFGSAFCASLKHYFKEVQPTLELLPAQLYGWLLDIVTEDERDLRLIHPVLPDKVPNFLKGLEGQLREGSPRNLTGEENLSFMDAGAELNIPYYPLLRRNVDCIIALDASADSQDLWFTRAEELAIRRGLRTWPKGARWPTEVRLNGNADEETNESERQRSEDPGAHTATRKLARTQETELAGQTTRQDTLDSREMPQRSEDSDSASRFQSLRTCEVWIGSSSADAEGSSRLDDLDEDALLTRDGIGVVYIPLAPNELKMPGFDPFVISTWRREVSVEESQALLDVAQANFEHSKDKIVKLLRAIWLRKKHARQQKEWREHLRRFRKNLRQDMF
ncbi:hypothetical protein NM688_g3054 [Phlebia brevispora]|uniref:Uncharacterized protein n=1 Tax=Phlebia brevispora TaxID=194682 RepID=A0ACC1T715_9APHY|nr:hypothetical protein NM688_g3054 [Phlebia brevispora]